MAPLGCRVDIVHIAQVISSELAIASFPDPRAALTVLSLAEFNHIAFVRVAEQVKLLLRISALADHKIFDIAQAFNDILLHLGGLELRDHLLNMLVLSLQICLLLSVIFRLNRLLSLLFNGRRSLLRGAGIS